MVDNTNRNRLRHAGRIPQETLDYLASKRRWDNRLRWWDLPVFFIGAVSLVLLVPLLFQSHKPSESFRILALVFLLSTTLLLRIRSFFV
jgi:hypothetical protein